MRESLDSDNLIVSKPFIRNKLDEERGDEVTFTVWMNATQYRQLQADKLILHQDKDSTALKQLATMGSNLLGSSLLGDALKVVFKNKRRKWR